MIDNIHKSNEIDRVKTYEICGSLSLDTILLGSVDKSKVVEDKNINKIFNISTNADLSIGSLLVYFYIKTSASLIKASSLITKIGGKYIIDQKSYDVTQDPSTDSSWDNSCIEIGKITDSDPEASFNVTIDATGIESINIKYELDFINKSDLDTIATKDRTYVEISKGSLNNSYSITNKTVISKEQTNYDQFPIGTILAITAIKKRGDSTHKFYIPRGWVVCDNNYEGIPTNQTDNVIIPNLVDRVIVGASQNGNHIKANQTYKGNVEFEYNNEIHFKLKMDSSQVPEHYHTLQFAHVGVDVDRFWTWAAGDSGRASIYMNPHFNKGHYLGDHGWMGPDEVRAMAGNPGNRYNNDYNSNPNEFSDWDHKIRITGGVCETQSSDETRDNYDIRMGGNWDYGPYRIYKNMVYNEVGDGSTKLDITPPMTGVLFIVKIF